MRCSMWFLWTAAALLVAGWSAMECAAQPVVGPPQDAAGGRLYWDLADASEDDDFLEAIELIKEEKYDEAEALLREIEAADENHWLEKLGEEHTHWLVDDYLGVCRRRRAGDGETDLLYASRRFRLHARDPDFTVMRMRQVAGVLEETLSETVESLGRGVWEVNPPRVIFVHISSDVDTDELARSLEYYWDRPERARRVAINPLMARSGALSALAARELSKVVAPHTCLPLAEGLAEQTMITVDRDRRILSRRVESTPHWPLEELLRWNVRAEGELIRESLRSRRSERGDDRALALEQQRRALSGKLVRWIVKTWGAEAFNAFYDATSGDPAQFDIMDSAAEQLAPRRMLERRWLETWEPEEDERLR